MWWRQSVFLTMFSFSHCLREDPRSSKEGKEVHFCSRFAFKRIICKCFCAGGGPRRESGAEEPPKRRPPHSHSHSHSIEEQDNSTHTTSTDRWGEGPPEWYSASISVILISLVFIQAYFLRKGKTLSPISFMWLLLTSLGLGIFKLIINTTARGYKHADQTSNSISTRYKL